MDKKTVAVAILIITVIVTVTGILYLRPAEQPQIAEPEKLTLGVEKSLLPSAVWVARHNGYFKKEGIDISIKEFDSGKASFNAMLNNEGIHISTVAPTPIMFNSFKRKDFSIFATFVHSVDDVKIIARKDKGVITAKDLRGRKIGTPSGTTGQFFVNSFLTFHGIPLSQVSIVDISPSHLPAALANNDVDAIVIWEPHAYKARQLLRENAARVPSSEIYWETFNFMVMNDFAKNRPRAIRKFLRAISRATLFINKHRQKAQAIVAERLKLDKAIVTALWDDFVFELSLNQELVVTLEVEARWAINERLTGKKEVPNYLDYIYLDALKEINPQSIKIFH
ncbi:MAG: NrtA/SsuA/CpmA family ABC transporter substrate-binding protein [Deltaproteobacteria bacterium]|nr:NrtA/SsuA/CpmA family ABC transporter substrate-binding protein [Deltaproteobacteria bacterium]